MTLRRMYWVSYLFRAILGLGLFYPAMASFASTLSQLGIEEMTGACDFIFEGRVVGQQVKAEPTGEIKTHVTFEVMDVIKGDYSQESVELKFFGGSLSGRSVKVSDMHLPQVGEQGIYFVESLDNDLINPLCGWDQGHFIVARDVKTGAEALETSRHRPIYGLDLGTSGAGQEKRLSRGIASGIRLQQATGEQPMSPQDFKNQLRDLLAGGVR